MEIRLLGAVEVRADAGMSSPAGSQLRGLLALLALDAGSTVPSSRLVEALWGEGAPTSNALHVAVSKLRRILADVGEPDRIVRRPSGYMLEVGRDEVDALRFEVSLDRSRRLRPDWRSVVVELDNALRGWSGEPLSGVPDTPTFVIERTRLEELHRIALEDVAEARLHCDDHVRVVPELEALVATEPLRERRWALLMRALYGSGRQADALAVYGRARAVLVEQAGTEPGPELRALYDAALAQDDSLAGEGGVGAGPVGASFHRTGNVRHPIDALIGRSAELDRLVALLDAGRLVTVVGAGGVGKTRLTAEVSAARVGPTPDGVWWVDLAPANTGGGLAALQRVLGVEGGGTEATALDLVCAVLEHRSVLIVLDNCEHLVDELAPVVVDLLARCRDVRVLATSREALGIPGEAVLLLEPLDAADAAALFGARVAVPIDGDTGTSLVVDEICRRLDCLPLAVELAAARAQHLRLDELLERLDDTHGVLAGGPRGGPARQRDLTAVADWSYGLLDEPEQHVFERLSVFSDGATVPAARVVCAAPGVDENQVEEHLRRLVDKSLVVADRAGATTRYRMLQTLAEFASQRLSERGARAVTAHAHARWVRRLAATVGWRARIDGPTVAAIHEEDAAVGQAISWASANDPVLALEICDDLAPYWFGAMRVSTGWELMRTAIDADSGVDAARRASVLGWGAVFATLAHELDVADRFVVEAWDFELERGVHERLGRLCWLRALAAGYRADGELSRWVSLAREHLGAAGVEVGIGHVEFAEGAGLLVAGETELAARCLQDAIGVFRREDDHLGLVLAVSRLGELAWRVGDIELFAEMHEDLLALGHASRTQGVVAGASARLAMARLEQGDVDDAQRLARAALAATSESFMPVVNGYAFRSAGLVDLRTGHRAAGQAELRMAIEAFEVGAGSVGAGQAALCWIDLSRSHLADGDADAARSAADAAERMALRTGDPWVVDQATANCAAMPSAST